MITLTEQAATKVKALMEQQEKSDAALRVFVQGGGCAGFKYGMAFDDQVEETDQVMNFHGVKVVIDEMSAPYLDGAEVDYTESLEGSGFAITNPNVESACGCGSSFKQKEGEEAAAGHSHGHGHSHGGGCCG